MDRREVLAQGAVAAAALLLGGNALAGGRVLVLPAMELQEGHTWVVLPRAIDGKARQFIRRNALGRLARAHGACPTYLFTEGDAAALLGGG